MRLITLRHTINMEAISEIIDESLTHESPVAATPLVGKLCCLTTVVGFRFQVKTIRVPQ